VNTTDYQVGVWRNGVIQRGDLVDFIPFDGLL
jgi:hypothetical protein